MTLLKVTWFLCVCVLHSFFGLDAFREQKTTETTTTFRWHFEIICSFYVPFISFHSIPLQSTLFVVFDGRKSARKNEAIFTHFGGQSAVIPFNKAIFSWIFCIPSLKQNQILFFVLTKIQRPFDNDDQQRVFIGFKFNKKMHFFPKWTRVLEAEIYEYEFIHSIGPTS